jgi:hypothetical protein
MSSSIIYSRNLENNLIHKEMAVNTPKRGLKSIRI